MDEPVKETMFGNDCLQWQIGKLRESKYPLLSQANCHDLDVDPEQIIVVVVAAAAAAVVIIVKKKKK